jgi:transcriptional regulator with GAF, ATPase, and Fis domain
LARHDLVPETSDEIVPDSEMKRRERANIQAALQRCAWKVYGPEGAAKLLDLRPTTLVSRMKKLRLHKSRGA